MAAGRPAITANGNQWDGEVGVLLRLGVQLALLLRRISRLAGTKAAARIGWDHARLGRPTGTTSPPSTAGKQWHGEVKLVSCSGVQLELLWRSSAIGVTVASRFMV